MDDFTYQHFIQWAMECQIPEDIQRKMINAVDSDPSIIEMGWPLIEQAVTK